jgi:integrase
LEINLTAVRDLAIFITDQRDAQGWESVAVADVEAFLATKSASNGVRQLHCLRAFFRWARTKRVIAVEPTRGIEATSNFAFRARVLDGAAQRALFRRWSHDTTPLHPHEAAAGLLGLLHGASSAELRTAQIHDIDLSAGTIRLGSRPEHTPLDPPTSLAIKRCLEGRTPAQRLNPHLFVNQSSKTGHGPVSVSYLERLLAPVGATPRQLRATRLAHLVTVMDPILVANAFGIKNGAALHYLADSVDEGRIVNL